ncbi:hypothetical protein L2E82_15088 [Cichorium intybus]|uniref:Uncharacterized protein n=1 Tax=Cichorium intybus TaxID=13427 RepID=A0ACB9F1U2_CICIN|nr:hypothetical protein L2E82_15088 [Cichorium intybus]
MDLNKIFIDYNRLAVNVSKYKRKEGISAESLKVKEPRKEDKFSAGNAKSEAQNLRSAKSYSEVVSGACNFSGVNVQMSSCVGKKVITIPDAIIPSSLKKFDGCLVGEARDLDLLEKFFSIFSASGLVDCSLKYLGGLNVLIDFEKKNVAEAFLADHVEGWRKWFAWLRVLFPFKGSLQARNCSYGRLCILAKHDSLINECVEVRWKEKSCWVRVQEDGVEWCPPCIVDSSVSVSEEDSFDGDEGEGDEIFDTGIDIGRDLFEKDVNGNKSADDSLPVENFEISKDMHAFNNNNFDTHAKNNQHGDASVNDTHAKNNNTIEIDEVVDSVNKNGTVEEFLRLVWAV